MSLYKENTKVGSNIYYNGTKLKNVYFNNTKVWSGIVTPSRLPYDFQSGCAVVLNDEIHILGGDYYSGHSRKHYKWDGTSWTSVSILPYDLDNGNAIVVNNEIHILGANKSSDKKKHYKWNGTSWTSVSTLPVESRAYDSCFILNNFLHVKFYYGYFYKWNGTSWIDLGSSLNVGSEYTSGAVLNNNFHIFYNTSKRYHKKYNGSTWSDVSTYPDYMNGNNVVVQNNQLHMLGNNRDDSFGKKHYKWNGTSWVSVSTLPYFFGSYYQNLKAVVLNDIIYTLGSDTSYSSYQRQSVAWWDGNSWTLGS